MVRYSVLLPQREAANEVSQRLPQLCQVLDDLLLPYEIICIDDASQQSAAKRLQELLGRYAHFRVLRFDEARGLAAATTAGIAASRGEVLLAMDAHDEHAPMLLSQLLSRLSRHDVAIVRRSGTTIQNVRRGLRRMVHVLTRSKQWCAGSNFLWAANRKALHGITLPAGSFGCIEAHFAQYGKQVCLLDCIADNPPQTTTYRPGLAGRLMAWWLSRHFEPHLASEMQREGDDGGELPDDVPPRFDFGQSRPVPPPIILPVDKKPHDST